MAIAGFPESHPDGPLTGRAAGSGFPPLAGPGFLQNPGGGHRITMADGLSFLASAGHGCPGLDLSASPMGMVIVIMHGARRWCTSSIIQYQAATTWDGSL